MPLKTHSDVQNMNQVHIVQHAYEVRSRSAWITFDEAFGMCIFPLLLPKQCSMTLMWKTTMMWILHMNSIFSVEKMALRLPRYQNVKKKHVQYWLMWSSRAFAVLTKTFRLPTIPPTECLFVTSSLTALCLLQFAEILKTHARDYLVVLSV